MIVLPRLLKEQLHNTTSEQQKVLALRFARRGVLAGAELVRRSMMEASLSYLDSAEAYLAGSAGMDQLAEAHAEFHRSHEDGDKVSRDVTWLAAIAVMAACQRDLEKAQVVVPRSYMPDSAVVAEEAQAIMAQLAVMAGIAEGDPARERRMRHEAKWEEARAQLVTLIELVPLPGPSGDDSE